ncbi:hypothetical protein BU24DRAFT_427014 [Aaosphaeria arxii CBS 175.79]|uniref:Uncharacterized protein n=1 Tax=Aaosphaeria arxii CBS 175.79 TaxID=1450172 RepID=A0A6A5XD67_9PLEO|nr:uncharacterized protein BU24DRAFT_427014 [Aaosphaeria arxii CBS 175.79]KAF2010813.1 hypothetical protein BU24DRAFT_427014 [Aaosphaeria arxii CBS 175.79]
MDPTSTRCSVDGMSPSKASTIRLSHDIPRENSTSSTSSTKPTSTGSKLVAALKKPFQGWSKELLAARDGLDDDYNFASGRRLDRL